MAEYRCETFFTPSNSQTLKAVCAQYSEGSAHITLHLNDCRLTKEEAHSLGEWLIQMSNRLPARNER